jgi:thiamine biosynthesis lipoprotein
VADPNRSRGIGAGGRRLLAVAACVAWAGCGAAERPGELRLEGEALGTSWSVVAVGTGLDAPERARELKRRVASTLERVEQGMSTWREESELSRFNRSGGLTPFAFGAETRRVVEAALTLSRDTGGAFDPTVGPLVAAWGFGAQAALEDPDAAALRQLRERVGWRLLSWSDRGQLVRRVPGVELDLSAIAKGWAVDAVVAELAADRPAGLLVEVGGEVRGFGVTAAGEAWRVGIESPALERPSLVEVVALTGAALATSGDYRNVRWSEGVPRSHVIDPRTGRPADAGVASVSVVAPDCMQADAVATALMVMGADAGLAWVEERPWLEALMLLHRGEQAFTRRASSGWSRWRVPED